MQRGDLVFGGVGAGLCGMLIFVVLTVFIALLSWSAECLNFFARK